jgi:glycosyltransferase involved in cell wall biosynthesis
VSLEPSHPPKAWPRITIVTPSYNQGQFLEEAIRSVLDQEYPNLEYLIMDGGSSDRTVEILKKYDGRLQWWSERDRGQTHAINKGFRRATGEILGWLNSDDLYEPGALRKVATYLIGHPEIDLVYGEGYLMNADGSNKRRFPATEPSFDLHRLINIWDYLLQQATFFRRSLIDRIGYLDESLAYGMDWDYWIRAGKAARVGYLGEYLGTLREYETAKSFAGGFERIRELHGIARRHVGKRWPRPSVIIYASDWMESSIYRRVRKSLGVARAEALRKVLRGLLGWYIQRQLRTGPHR